jgi:hypothetical protein
MLASVVSKHFPFLPFRIVLCFQALPGYWEKNSLLDGSSMPLGMVGCL